MSVERQIDRIGLSEVCRDADFTSGLVFGDLAAGKPELAHAIVDVEPRLTHILEALIAGYL